MTILKSTLIPARGTPSGPSFVRDLDHSVTPHLEYLFFALYLGDDLVELPDDFLGHDVDQILAVLQGDHLAPLNSS